MTVVSQECAMEYKKNANTDNSFITVLAFNSLLLSLSERALGVSRCWVSAAMCSL